MVNFVIQITCGDPRVLLELSLFDCVAILNWVIFVKPWILPMDPRVHGQTNLIFI